MAPVTKMNYSWKSFKTQTLRKKTNMSTGEIKTLSLKIVYLGSFGSVVQSRLTLCNPMDCSTPGFPVHHQLPEFTQTHVHWVGDAIQTSHPLLSPSPPPQLQQTLNAIQLLVRLTQIITCLKQNFILSQFRRPDVQSQGLGVLIPFWKLGGRSRLMPLFSVGMCYESLPQSLCGFILCVSMCVFSLTYEGVLIVYQ